MKNYIILFLSIVFVSSIIFCSYLYKKNIEVNKKYSNSENNYKASIRKNLSYVLTIDQQNASLDSLDIKLNKFKSRLSIRDKKINSLMIIVDSLKKQDTIIFRDTIFVKDLKFDTIIGDRWIRKKLSLKYPNEIRIDEEIYNEKNIVWRDRRETIKPPYKFFLFRWFQKKQTVVEITIKDLNPYFKTKEFKYNTIIK